MGIQGRVRGTREFQTMAHIGIMCGLGVMYRVICYIGFQDSGSRFYLHPKPQISNGLASLAVGTLDSDRYSYPARKPYPKAPNSPM